MFLVVISNDIIYFGTLCTFSFFNASNFVIAYMIWPILLREVDRHSLHWSANHHQFRYFHIFRFKTWRFARSGCIVSCTNGEYACPHMIQIGSEASSLASLTYIKVWMKYEYIWFTRDWKVAFFSSPSSMEIVFCGVSSVMLTHSHVNVEVSQCHYPLICVSEIRIEVKRT